MKIIQVIPEFGLAGAETMCENLTYELKKRGQDVIIISMYDYHSPITERMEKAGIDIRYLDKKPGFDISIIAKMKKIFRKENPDVIHTHLYAMKYAVLAAITEGVKRRVHTVHNIAQKESGGTARKLNKIFYKCFHVTPVALSELIRDSIILEYELKSEDIPVIFNGIDLSKCISKDNYDFDGKFKILHIGRFSEQKNHIGLMKAFRMFHEKYKNAELLLIGDGEKRQEIERYVNEHKLESHVRFLGLQENVYGFLHEADVFILPSNYEGVPMTLIEAMGTGLPIVATAVGGIPDMLIDEDSALLVNNSPQEISDALSRLFMDENLRTKCGIRARERSNMFSSVQMTNSYIEVFKRR